MDFFIQFDTPHHLTSSPGSLVLFRISPKARWKLLRVVPSLYALNLMRKRSREVDSVKSWAEMFDPLTNTFWYYNKEEANNGIPNSCWDPPKEFTDKLTCVWEPVTYPHLSQARSNNKCCMRFKTRREYNTHRIEQHSWTCPGCETFNTGLTYPKCYVCDNTLGPDGENLVSKMKNDVAKVLFRLNNPRLFSEDGEEDETDRDSDENDADDDDTQVGFSGGLPVLGPDAGIEKFTEQLEIRKEEKFAQKQRELKRQKELAGEKLPAIGGGNSGTVQDGAGGGSGGNGGSGGGGNGVGSYGNEFKTQLDSRNANGALVPHNAAAAGAIITSSPGMMGDQTKDEPELKTDIAKCKEDVYNCSEQFLTVCRKFRKGTCTKTTCPRAHPGLRDEAELFPVEGKGKRDMFFVKVCYNALLTGSCKAGKKCPLYHPYVRPSTNEIIRKIYPKRNGLRHKESASGMTIDGFVEDEVFQGYGVIEWDSGDVYIGDLKDGIREGSGIWRSADGSKEYIGTWLGGHRHGWGILEHPNGEKYEGEWEFGKMHGVGRLSSANGDCYEGGFANGKYHGIGVFRKANGDVFMGYSEGGFAVGLGVIVYATGEKYKGYFADNKRNGKGVCIYPNKCKYSGYWSDGFHDGFGVFVTPDNAAYAGQWRRSKKHGLGRYYFPNGDFYDGSFHSDKADGHGVYRYKDTENVFLGAWKNDKRNGKGCYLWRNGSKYDGYWVDNDIDGKGVFEFQTGAKYAGNFKKNLKHGKGVFIWPTGNKFSGQFKDDKLEGMGEMVYAGGHTYSGLWSNNKKNGRGIFKYKDGNIYDGEFVDDGIHGKGRMTYMPGTLLEEMYDGQWKHGKKHGLGKYVYRAQDGLVYEGSWYKGLRHGKGILKFKDGSFYKGDFKKERMTGTGIYVWADGSQYEGAFLNNIRHGYGVYLSNAGVIYSGNFDKGLKHGKGRIQYLDGNAYVGEWDHDVIKGRGKFEFHATDQDEDVIKLRVFGF